MLTGNMLTATETSWLAIGTIIYVQSDSIYITATECRQMLQEYELDIQKLWVDSVFSTSIRTLKKNVPWNLKMQSALWQFN